MQDERLWIQAAQIEKGYGTKEALCLMSSKAKWLAGNMHTIRVILDAAEAMFPNSMDILLKPFKLAFEEERLLSDARMNTKCPARVWIK